VHDFPRAILEPQGSAADVPRGPREPKKCAELNPFHRLLLTVTVRLEWAPREVEAFVTRVLGSDFVNPLIFTRSLDPPIDMIDKSKRDSVLS
jgi:hypothetical protein